MAAKAAKPKTSPADKKAKGKSSPASPSTPLPGAPRGPYKGKFAKALVREALEAAQGSKVAASRLLGCSRSTLDRYIAKSPELAEVHGDLIAGHIDEIEKKVFEKAKKGDMSAALFILRTIGRNRGYVEARPQAAANAVPPATQKTLEQLRDGKISVAQAALELEMHGQPLPESLKILLARENPEPPDPSAGQYSILSDEEMERRAAERQAAIQRQKDGLPERRVEINALRAEIAGSFAPENTGESPARAASTSPPSKMQAGGQAPGPSSAKGPRHG